MRSRLRIATRKSPLALWQAQYVVQQLQQWHPELGIDIVAMTTRGDQLLDNSLAKEGGKGLFLKELEVSLLNNDTDIAVHSMKDVPASLPEGLEIPVVCQRHDPRDALVSNQYANLYALPVGARVGTSSLRRVAQLRYAFPKLNFVPLRGNVNTRLQKLDDGDYEAIILAAAGLARLGLKHRINQTIPPAMCLPAVGQGVIGIECREFDDTIRALIQPLHDESTAVRLAAEREMNSVLEGGCQMPVAGFADIVNGSLSMQGRVAAVDGQEVIHVEKSSHDYSIEGAQQLGRKVGKALRHQGAGRLLQAAVKGLNQSSTTRSKVVLLTRQPEFSGNMQSVLEQLGCTVACIETLQIDPLSSPQAEQHFHQLEQFTDLIFVSRNAVEKGMSLINNLQVVIPKKVNVMAIGIETAKQLQQYDIEAVFPRRGNGAEALLRARNMRDLNGRRILMVRGVQGLTWPSEEMRERGADVVHADVYQQAIPSDGAQRFAELVQTHPQIDVVFLHSGLSASNFMQLARPHLPFFAGSCLLVGSARIAEVARQLGWQEEITVAESATNKHMINAFNEANK